MNSGNSRVARLALGLAAYLALWATIAAGIIYGIVRAGYPAWLAVASAFLLFVFVNGSLAYGARVRQLRLEGKEPPPRYLQYLFFPQGLPKRKAAADRATHLLVGIAATLTGAFLVLCGVALAFDAEWSRLTEPFFVAAVCIVVAGIGVAFLYLAWRILAFARRPPARAA